MSLYKEKESEMRVSEEPKKTCYTPSPGRKGTTRIPIWKYECIRRAIFDVLEHAPDKQVQFKHLADLVRARLTQEQLSKLGSVKWHVTTVKLNMEVEDELKRLAGLKPQTLQRSIQPNATRARLSLNG